MRSHPEEKRAWSLATGPPQNWGFHFNVSATTESSDFKIGRLAEFAKAHHKISCRRKKVVALSEGSPKHMEFSL